MVLYIEKTFKNCSNIKEKLQAQHDKLITLVFHQSVMRSNLWSLWRCHTLEMADQFHYSWPKLNSFFYKILILNPPCWANPNKQSEVHLYWYIVSHVILYVFCTHKVVFVRSVTIISINVTVFFGAAFLSYVFNKS